MKKSKETRKEYQKLNLKYKWNGMTYPSNIDDWKMFEKNNPTIALNISHIKENRKCPAYISKHN